MRGTGNLLLVLSTECAGPAAAALAAVPLCLVCAGVGLLLGSRYQQQQKE